MTHIFLTRVPAGVLRRDLAGRRFRMTFVRATADENFPLVKFATASGRWELGLSPALFGVRVRAGVPAEQFLAIDYCAGADFIFQMRVLECVLNILRARG